jgi:hypothetical protein
MPHLLSRLWTLAPVIVLVGGGVSCGHGSSPTNPSPSGSAISGRSYTSIAVEVEDPLHRLIQGAEVVVVDGPRAGASMVTSFYGDSRLSGPFDGATPVTLRISRNGLVTKTQTVRLSGFGDAAYVLLQAETTDNAQIAPGDYTLTVTPDDACVDLPAELRTRTYAATIPIPPPDSPSRYRVALAGAEFVPPDIDSPPGAFDLVTAGHDVGIPSPNGDFVKISLEQITPSATFLMVVYDRPIASVTSSVVSALNLTVRGAFIYSETTTSARKDTQSPARVASCYFSHGQLRLARR